MKSEGEIISKTKSLLAANDQLNLNFSTIEFEQYCRDIEQFVQDLKERLIEDELNILSPAIAILNNTSPTISEMLLDRKFNLLWLLKWKSHGRYAYYLNSSSQALNVIVNRLEV